MSFNDLIQMSNSVSDDYFCLGKLTLDMKSPILLCRL